jgi:hypothetical protein
VVKEVARRVYYGTGGGMEMRKEVAEEVRKDVVAGGTV